MRKKKKFKKVPKHKVISIYKKNDGDDLKISDEKSNNLKVIDENFQYKTDK